MELAEYTLNDILVFMLAIYSAIMTIYKLKELGQKWYNSRKSADNMLSEYQKQVTRTLKDVDSIYRSIEEVKADVKLLIDSDREDIKSYIVQAYNEFVIEKKCIDANSLEALEKRYQYYTKEHGNGFITALMEELRGLPKVSREELDEHEY